MPNAFVPLYDYIRSAATPIATLCEEHEEPEEDIEQITEDPLLQSEMPYESIFSDIRHFRAHLADALDRAREKLLQDLACHVLARELSIKPVEIATLVSKLLEDFGETGHTAVRVHPDDLAQLRDIEMLDCQVIPDVTLHRGDAMLELSDGTVDARLGVRLDNILRQL